MIRKFRRRQHKGTEADLRGDPQHVPPPKALPLEQFAAHEDLQVHMTRGKHGNGESAT